jgi:hypothetical protein
MALPWASLVFIRISRVMPIPRCHKSVGVSIGFRKAKNEASCSALTNNNSSMAALIQRFAGFFYTQTRQDKTRQDKTRQDKAKQGKARQGKARQGKALKALWFYFWH